MQIERNIKIVYRWWNSEKEIPFKHLELLEQSAEKRIFELRGQGYCSGELNEEIDNISYEGYWEFNYVGEEQK